MNYIPGFSNYLETTASRYARGGPARPDENEMYGGGYDGSPLMYSDPMAAAAPSMDAYQQAAVMPMTTEAVAPAVSPATTSAGAVAPYDLSALAGLDLSGLYGMNFGTDFGGGAMGGIYPDDPNTEFIAAPLSNKGNATSRMGGNAFEVRVDQPVRLVDHRTNQVVFEGTGYDAARKATELGQGLSDTQGRKANYSIQTADPAGNYSTVAYETKNKSTLGEIANVAGTVLPLAMMAIPGVNTALLGAKLAAQIPAQIALGALTGAASSGLKGQNILKGAALGGLTAAGGALIPKIPAIGDLGNLARPIGTGIGATAGGLATGQNLKNSLLGGVASGALAYAAPSIQDAIKGIGQGPNLSTGSAPSATPSGPAPMTTVVGNTGVSAPVSFGGGSSPQTKVAELEQPATIVSGSGSPFAAAFPIPSNVLSMAQPTPKPAADQMAEEELIKVTGALPGAAPSINLGSGRPSPILDKIDQPAETLSPEEILVEARKSFSLPVNVDLSNVTRGGLATATEPTPEEILVKARETFTPPNVNLSTIPAGALSTVAEPTLTPEEILVEARKSFTPPVSAGTTTGGATAAQEPLIKVTGRVTEPGPAITTGGTTAVEEPLIKVTGRRTEPGSAITTGGTTAVEEPLIKVTGRQTTTPPVLWGVEKPLPDLSKTDADAEAEKKKNLGLGDYLEIASLLAGLIPGGKNGGNGTSGTYGGTGNGRLNPIFSAQLPAAGALGTVGATRTARPLGDVDWLTYGQRPELKFFDYATPNNPAPVTTPVPGNPAGPIMGGGTVRHSEEGIPLWMQLGLPNPNAPAAQPAGQIMEERDPTAMAEGGSLAAKRGGRSRRTEFAVNGPGTGRSDEIPAVLSDGEYVIDAETVALLGDGSSKAGAKKLDDLRVKVRKHKGKKLAKGRFSANAKKPEAYLSGGRI